MSFPGLSFPQRRTQQKDGRQNVTLKLLSTQVIASISLNLYILICCSTSTFQSRSDTLICQLVCQTIVFFLRVVVLIN